MKQPPYFKLTEVEPQVAIWASLLLMLSAITMTVLVSNRLSNVTDTAPGIAQPNSPQQQSLLRALQQTFAAESQQGIASIKNARTHLQLTFNSQLLFAPHGTEISPAGKNALNRLAQTLKSFPIAGYQHVHIEGHTEQDGFVSVNYPHDNWELSTGQAMSVLRYLSSAANLDGRLFSVHGFLDARPVNASRTEAGKIMNRRLEINIFQAAYQP